MLKRGFQFAPGYRLQEFLGRGQFGQVWRATAPGGTAMAAKFIDLSDGQGQKEYEGVKRVKQVRHANLMPITALWLLDAQGQMIEEAPNDVNETIDLSVVESQGRSAFLEPLAADPSWLVVGMLLGGKSLQYRLRECVGEGLPGIPPKELIAYLDESAKGIDFLNAPQHDLGEGLIAIQHSDVKPANIVLIGSSAVVCDFGLARILTRNQVTATSAAGTPAYMAPEAISGKPSCHSDQYSLAVTYYHLRTGNLPVSDGSLWEVLDAHRTGKLNLSLVPEAEQAVLRKATHLDWSQRFDSNVEMVDAMRDALRAEGHTKPSFISSEKSPPSKVKEGSSRAEILDETVGLAVEDAANDSQPEASQNVVRQSLLGTDAVNLADTATQKEGFANETLPGLSDRTGSGVFVSSARESHSSTGTAGSLARTAWGWGKQNRMLAGAAAGCLAVLIGFLIWRPTNHDSGEKVRGDEAQPDLVAQAMELFPTNEAQATLLFREALDSDRPPTLLPERLVGLQGAVMKMDASTDGAKLIAMADGPTPLVWNLNQLKAEPVPLSGHERRLHTFAIHPSDDRVLTCGADWTVRVWKLGSADVPASVLPLEGHKHPIEAIAWHPMKDVAVSAAADLTLRIWEFGQPDSSNPNGTVKDRPPLPIQENLISLASDAQGRWLAAITLGGDLVESKIDLLVYPWDSLLNMKGVPEPRRFGAENVKHIDFLNDSAEPTIVTGDRGGSISFYSADSGQLLQRIDEHHADVEALRVIAADSQHIIVSAAADGTVQHIEYGVVPRKTIREFCPSLGVSCVDVTADGRWVASGCGDGAVWIWDTSADNESGTGAFRIDTGTAGVDSVLFDESRNRVMVGCDDGAIRVYDLTVAKMMTLASPTPTTDGPEREVTTPQISQRIH